MPLETALKSHLPSQLDYMERVLEALQEVQNPFEALSLVSERFRCHQIATKKCVVIV